MTLNFLLKSTLAHVLWTVGGTTVWRVSTTGNANQITCYATLNVPLHMVHSIQCLFRVNFHKLGLSWNFNGCVAQKCHRALERKSGRSRRVKKRGIDADAMAVCTCYGLFYRKNYSMKYGTVFDTKRFFSSTFYFDKLYCCASSTLTHQIHTPCKIKYSLDFPILTYAYKPKLKWKPTLNHILSVIHLWILLSSYIFTYLFLDHQTSNFFKQQENIF